jgi:hypothetical protein
LARRKSIASPTRCMAAATQRQHTVFITLSQARGFALLCFEFSF